jgi:WD40 repeat protein
MGHLYLYEIRDKSISLVRFICNAHFEAVSSLAECPLSNRDETIFASASYDGILAIWSINSR